VDKHEGCAVACRMPATRAFLPWKSTSYILTTAATRTKRWSGAFDELNRLANSPNIGKPLSEGL